MRAVGELALGPGLHLQCSVLTPVWLHLGALAQFHGAHEQVVSVLYEDEAGIQELTVFLREQHQCMGGAGRQAPSDLGPIRTFPFSGASSANVLPHPASQPQQVEGHQAYCHDSLERNFRPCRRLATRTRLPRKGSLPNSRLGPDQASAPKVRGCHLGGGVGTGGLTFELGYSLFYLGASVSRHFQLCSLCLFQNRFYHLEGRRWAWP